MLGRCARLLPQALEALEVDLNRDLEEISLPSPVIPMSAAKMRTGAKITRSSERELLS